MSPQNIYITAASIGEVVSPVDCVNLEKNLEMCTCTYDCSKKGMCCECIASHRRRGEIPGCLFPPEVEKTFDRSVERFVECYR